MGSARGLLRAAVRTAIRQHRAAPGGGGRRACIVVAPPSLPGGPQYRARAVSSYSGYEGAPSSFTAQDAAAGPSEVQWTKERANSVQLIGNVGKDPQVRYLETGNVVANLSLAVRQRTLSRNGGGGGGGGGGGFPGADESTTQWYNVEMWGDLARQAEQYVRKGRQLYIEGNIKMDSWFDKRTEMQKVSPKIVARAFHFVAPYNAGISYGGAGGQPSASSPPPQPPPPPQQQQQAYAGPTNTEDMWRALFANPQEFFDNRNSKMNEKQPDFKSAKTGAALWLTSRNTPDWVFDEMAMRESEGNFNCIRTNKNRSGEGEH